MKRAMKRLTMAAGVLLLGATLQFGVAKDANKETNTTTTNPTMTAPVNQPQTRNTQPVKRIWEYKDELSLSNDQVKNLKNTVEGLNTNLVSLRNKWMAVEQEINQLQVKNAELGQIKTKLQESAGIQVEMRYTDFETARKVMNYLSPEQVTKWRDIQKKIRATSSTKNSTTVNTDQNN